jgi:hypothetical protein
MRTFCGLKQDHPCGLEVSEVPERAARSGEPIDKVVLAQRLE